MRGRRNTLANFWDFVDKTGPNGCWLWTGCCFNTGYGKFRLAQRTHTAHRLAYQMLVGEIPEGLHLDHLCRVRSCVNPAHLEAVTPAVNILRGISPSAINSRKTHCKRGHEFTPDNTYVTPNGKSRICRTCERAKHAAQRRQRAARRQTEAAA